MRLISLNTWGGRVYEPFFEFVEKYRQTADLYCFQEVCDSPATQLPDNAGARQNLFTELQAALPEHVGHFAPQVPGIGIAIFVRKTIPVLESKYAVVLPTEEMVEKYIPRVLQQVSIQQPALSIYNFHGVPKSDKRDTPERLNQTARVLEIMAADQNPKILIGDFNLRPDTESLRAFEKSMKNLVIDGGFKTTRSELYEWKAIQPFADYAFAWGIEVSHFEVLQDVVSDHLALLLDFK
jgi:endonuclease/exonuclease/phosphatase (EEP) superfamily protein YafD